MKFAFLCTAIVTATAACTAQAIDVPGPLVTASWVHKNLSKITLIDVRYDLKSFQDRPQYTSHADGSGRVLSAVGGHIPGALGLEYADIRVARNIAGTDISGFVPTAEEFESVMQSIGLNRDRTLIITSPGDNVSHVDSATRLFWTLKYFGQSKLAILDGGNAAWLQAGFPLASDAPPVRKGDWRAKTPNSALIADMDAVQAAQSSGVQLIDSRTASQYVGINKKSSVKSAGHVAGARNLPPELRTRSDGIAAMFLEATEYQSLMQTLGIASDEPTVHYCNSGHLASGSWFIQHELLGNTAARLYDGSMSEWTAMDNPVVGLKSK